MALVPCPECSRHVRDAEAACPFCGKDLPTNLKARAVPAATRRMDRFATFTFAAALAIAGTTGVGCSGSDDGRDDTEQSDDELRKKKDAGKDAAKKDAGCREVDDDPGGMIALYGMPPAPRPDDDDRPPCARDAGPAQDSGGIHAMYGAPPPTDDDDDNGTVRDGGGIHAMYGLPPHR